MEHENRPFSGQKATSDHHKYSEPKHRQIAPKLSQLIEFRPQGWIFGRIYTFGRQFAFLGQKLLILGVLMIYNMNNLGNWLLQERRIHRWSQAELARRAGVSRPTISNYESGKIQKPDPDVIQAIARALKIPPEDVFRTAGLLPPKPERTPANAQLDYLFIQLSPDDQAAVLDIVQAFLKRHEYKNQVPQTTALKNMG